jgi:hypothetical protein
MEVSIDTTFHILFIVFFHLLDGKKGAESVVKYTLCKMSAEESSDKIQSSAVSPEQVTRMR